MKATILDTQDSLSHRFAKLAKDSLIGVHIEKNLLNLHYTMFNVITLRQVNITQMHELIFSSFSS